VAYLWVHADIGPGGQVDILDSAWLGSSTRLRLVSHFDDGYPDFFDAGSITMEVGCLCLSHGDISDDGSFDVTDLVGLINIAFRDGASAITDPGCSHATRADYTCDGVINVVDVVRGVDFIFRAGPSLCDPCTS
jgi:hypothetical protein